MGLRLNTGLGLGGKAQPAAAAAPSFDLETWGAARKFYIDPNDPTTITFDSAPNEDNVLSIASKGTTDKIIKTVSGTCQLATVGGRSFIDTHSATLRAYNAGGSSSEWLTAFITASTSLFIHVIKIVGSPAASSYIARDGGNTKFQTQLQNSKVPKHYLRTSGGDITVTWGEALSNGVHVISTWHTGGKLYIQVDNGTPVEADCGDINGLSNTNLTIDFNMNSAWQRGLLIVDNTVPEDLDDAIAGIMALYGIE